MARPETLVRPSTIEDLGNKYAAVLITKTNFVPFILRIILTQHAEGRAVR